MTEPIVSVSGLRGIVGKSFTAEIIVPYIAAFADLVKKRKVVVGGDSRPSRAWAQPVVEAVLRTRGISVVSVDLATTPTIGMAVRHHKAGGAVAITASHNPIEWNGLKFFHGGGEFLTPAQNDQLKALIKSPKAPGKSARLGAYRVDNEANQRHIDAIVAAVNPLRGSRPRKLRVVLDCCNGAASIFGPLLANTLGMTVEVIFASPGRVFPRGAEPLAENIKVLRREVKRCGADFGAAFDPDGDRLALVDEKGRAIGEERTLILAADAYLALTKEKTPLVANLSTSMALEVLGGMYGCPVERTPIGEAHVVAGMREYGAAIGGEGNGGVILPAVHPGRDGGTALALVAVGLQRMRRPMSTWNASIPDFPMAKTKVNLQGLSMARTLRRARSLFKDAESVDERDGLKFIYEDRWLHLRPSNTEPIVRVFVEARDKTGAKELLARAGAILQ